MSQRFVAKLDKRTRNTDYLFFSKKKYFYFYSAQFLIAVSQFLFLPRFQTFVTYELVSLLKTRKTRVIIYYRYDSLIPCIFFALTEVKMFIFFYGFKFMHCSISCRISRSDRKQKMALFLSPVSLLT